jgi:hypothetical protein
MFQTLVNKLAQICDFEPKGNTVTALTVIWYNGRVCYVLASNRRGGGALKNARAGLNAVLGILKANLEASARVSDEEMEKRLLREILSWNNVRVRSYLISLSRELQVCMKRCDTSDSEGMWPSSKHYSNPSAAAEKKTEYEQGEVPKKHCRSWHAFYQTQHSPKRARNVSRH